MSTPLSRSDLTDTDIDAIGNGIGPDGSTLPFHEDFRWAGKVHDALYWIGGTEKDRAVVDLIFLKDMLVSASWRFWMWPFALVYYLAVVVAAGNSTYFKYGPKKTMADLEAHRENNYGEVY